MDNSWLDGSCIGPPIGLWQTRDIIIDRNIPSFFNARYKRELEVGDPYREHHEIVLESYISSVFNSMYRGGLPIAASKQRHHSILLSLCRHFKTPDGGANHCCDTKEIYNVKHIEALRWAVENVLQLKTASIKMYGGARTLVVAFLSSWVTEVGRTGQHAKCVTSYAPYTEERALYPGQDHGYTEGAEDRRKRCDSARGMFWCSMFDNLSTLYSLELRDMRLDCRGLSCYHYTSKTHYATSLGRSYHCGGSLSRGLTRLDNVQDTILEISRICHAQEQLITCCEYTRQSSGLITLRAFGLFIASSIAIDLQVKLNARKEGTKGA